ncbi:MAG TPA: endonuclease/exonuclease/phosphatase family protein [Pyrinomonadaceae bacterium]|nr:endonuclease/exonuclease/phosphatase family protein [Pyrinomonadaceae bacterium]
MTPERRILFYAFIPVIVLLGSIRLSLAQEVVLYASQAPVKVGNWSSVSDSTAAGGARLTNPDAGLAKITTPAANPSSYAEFTFSASSGKAYRLWIRGKAQSNSPYNDSIFVQFSGSVNSSGSAVYRIGTTSATEYNLEDCFGCGIQGWGWQDNGWGGMGPEIYFQSTGSQTIRIQPREDGLSIDQIVLSPSTYLYSSPGALKNDTVILTESSGSTSDSSSTTIPADTVIWASNIPSTGIKGAWAKESNSSAAGQVLMRHPDKGAAKLTAALASPTNYFDVSFPAEAGKPYRIWIRGRADNNHWGNDSVFAQFSGSVNSLGTAVYRIGTTSATEINLEDCSGCGISGWGWQDNGWGIGVLGPAIYFQSTGTQTLRIQTREDGFAIDQIVISSYAYLVSSPGLLKNDTTILQSTLGTTTNQPPTVSISATPTSGNSPLFVSFSSNASDPDGSIASYSWTFGDGNTSTAVNPTNTYQSAGTYTASLTVTDNGGATASASVSISVSSTQTTANLKVLSWNIAFGTGTDGLTNWDRTASWIASMNPDLAGLCEMPSEQISNLLNLLSKKTGRTWYYHFIPKYSGTSEGNLILSKYSFSSTGHRYLTHYRSVAQATLSVGGRTINFFATHLDPDSSSVRYAQVGELMNYASGFSEQRIVVGDFNGGPDTSESIRMTSSYYDSWMQAMNAGTAVAYPDNPVGMHTRTRRGRIDYVFYSTGAAALVLKGTQIPDTRDLNNKNVVILLGTADDKGVRPSDHNPMLATLDVK